MAERFVVRQSLAKLVFWLFCSLALILVAMFGAGIFGGSVRPGSEWRGWLGIVFFGICAVILAKRFFDDREWIVVDRNGFLWRQWSEHAIPWSAISSFGTARQITRWPFYVRYVCIDLHAPESHPPGSLRARLFGRGWNLGYGDITVSTIGTETDVEELIEAMEHFSNRTRSR